MKILRPIAILGLIVWCQAVSALSPRQWGIYTARIETLQNMQTKDPRELWNNIAELQEINNVVVGTTAREKAQIGQALIDQIDDALDKKVKLFQRVGGRMPLGGVFTRRKMLLDNDPKLSDPRTAAVLIIDVQDDFTEANPYKHGSRINTNGSLMVPNSGEEYVDQVVATTRSMKNNDYKIFVSQDFHPANHMSFASNHEGKSPFQTMPVTIPLADGSTKEIVQMLWPDHCIQGSKGADNLVPRNLISKIVQKGKNPDVDSYSAFADDGGQDTGLNKMLNDNGIKTLIMYGIATDYCVKFSVLHALERGKKVYLVTDLCRGVDAAGSQKAIEEMRKKGAIIITSDDL